MKRLDEALGFPHRAFRSVHVAGTNGKGSVAVKISAALREEGYRVGLYTSPHISDFRERVQIDGIPIQTGEVEEILKRLFSFVHEELSFFDLMTEIGFLHFQKEKVDWAVIEVGIGGRLDATNVIQPEIGAITSIGFDHMHILGQSLEAIAREKGGIVKPGIPLVVGPSAAPFFPHAFCVDPAPFYDLENQEVARRVLENLGISPRAIAKGIRARPPCRFERRGRYILDAAHNPDGFQKLIEALHWHFPHEKFHFVIAFTQEKNWPACVQLIRPHASKIRAIRGKSEKLIPPEEMASWGIDPIDSISDIPQSDEKIVICGSFYIMDDILNQLGVHDPE